MVIDFGSGHRGSDENEDTFDRGNAAFKHIEGQREHRKKVKRIDSMERFESYDFTALGKALSGMDEAFCSSAPADQRIAYSDFCEMLQDGMSKTWNQVRERFEHVVDPIAFITRTDHLFVRKDGFRPNIILPAGPAVPVGDAINRVVNTKAFQRLRAIKQLSFCEWQFPGGTHTRLEHSLGVFGVFHRCLGYLARNQNFKNGYTQKNVTGALAASLLHDVGHYPFAHVIEHYAASHFAHDQELKQSVHHFDNSLHLLETDGDLRDALDKWGEDVAGEATRPSTH